MHTLRNRLTALLFILSSAAFAQKSLLLTSCSGGTPANLYSRVWLENLSLNNAHGYCNYTQLTLTSEIVRLKKLRRLSVSGLALPEGISRLPELRELNSTTVTEEVFRCAKLESLDIMLHDSTSLRIFNEHIAQLQHLKELQLSLGAGVFPDNIRQLKTLERLRLSFAGSQIPGSIGELSALKELEIYSLQSLEAGPELGKLQQLQKLTLGGSVKRFPEAVYALPALEELAIHRGSFNEMPDGIGNLKKLRKMTIQGSPLSRLPADFSSLSGLEEIHLQYLGPKNHGSHLLLPENIGRLEKLRFIDIRNQGLEVLPVSVCTIASLEYLFLDDNQLEALPDALGQLSGLRSLSVSGNKLKTLPLSITNCKALIGLSCNYNELKKLPEDIGRLGNLRAISAYHNQLETLPESIAQLTKLENLFLSNNQLRSLPGGLARLDHVTDMELHGNSLQHFPEAVYGMRKLRKVFFDQSWEPVLKAKPLRNCIVLYR